MDEVVQLGRHPAGQGALGLVSGNDEGVAGGRDFHAERVLQAVQMRVVLAEKIA